MKKYFIIAILVGWFISFVGFMGLIISWLAGLMPYVREFFHKVRCFTRR